MNSENKDANHDNRFKDPTIQAQSNNMTEAACKRNSAVRKIPRLAGSGLSRAPFEENQRR